MEKDKLYIYPKSSCTCYGCTKNSYTFPDGKPSNLAVRGCKVSPYYDCFDRRLVGINDQPKDDETKHITFINPQLYTDNYAKNFDEVKCNDSSHCNHCTSPQFASWDPRTWSATRDQYLTFDNPPLDYTPKLKDIYNANMKNYGKNYETYSDINAGQIIYYTDSSREDAYYKPIFDNKVRTGTVMYQDPMGAMKPEYPRVVPYENPTTNNNCDNGDYCLSFIKDTNMFREDIIASNMAKTNQSRWMPRWVNFKQQK